MFTKNRQITFRIDICVENDGDSFHAYCPALEGVHVDGETRAKAIENAKIAIAFYIKSLIKHGDPIPLQIVRMVDNRERCQISSFPCPPQQTENVLVAV